MKLLLSENFFHDLTAFSRYQCDADCATFAAALDVRFYVLEA